MVLTAKATLSKLIIPSSCMSLLQGIFNALPDYFHNLMWQKLYTPFDG